MQSPCNPIMVRPGKALSAKGDMPKPAGVRGSMVKTARHASGLAFRGVGSPLRGLIALVLAYALAFGAMLGPSHEGGASVTGLALEQCRTDATSSGDQPTSPHALGHDQCCLAACTPLALLTQDPGISSLPRWVHRDNWARDHAGLPFGFPSSASSHPRAPPRFV